MIKFLITVFFYNSNFMIYDYNLKIIDILISKSSLYNNECIKYCDFNIYI